jgi:asparagine synthase (glutamine-hydrolysing)
LSAVAGVLRFDGAPADRAGVDALLAAMAHRAPDGSAVWCDGPVALGHGALRVDVRDPAGPEIATLTTPRHALVFEGRIDNREELLTALRAAGRDVSNAASDAVVVLEACVAWGERAPERLLGEFAFAHWDAGAGRLRLVRDPLGARSIHYHVGKDFLAFATEGEALLALPVVPARYCEGRLVELLVPWLWNPLADWTYYEDIRRLLPGHWLAWDLGGHHRACRYWALAPRPELRLRNDAEYEEALREVLLEAVRCRLQAATPPVLMLSGGLDSLSVLGAARALERAGRAPRLHVWALVRRDPECVESRNIRAATAGFEDSSVLVDVDGDWTPDFERDAARAVWERPHPTDCSIPSVQLCALMAGRAGSRVVLSGVSGDLALHGPSNPVVPLVQSLNLRGAWREARLASLHHTYLHGTAPWRLVAGAVKDLAIPTGLRRWRLERRLAREGLGPLPVDGIPSHAAANPISARIARLREGLAPETRHGALGHVQALELGSVALGLEGYGRTVAWRGIEHRDPWSDRRVVDFLLSVPPTQRSGAGWTKWIARRACSPWLPPGLLWHSHKYHLGGQLCDRLERLPGAPDAKGGDPRAARPELAVPEWVWPALATPSARAPWLDRYTRRTIASWIGM